MLGTSSKARVARHRGHPGLGLLVFLVGIGGGLAGLWGLMRWTQARYANRIYPRVSVLGTNLGGLRVAEAEVRLLGLSGSPAGAAYLTDGEHTWRTPWSDLGIQVDTEVTAAAAYAIGHQPEDAHPRRWLRVWTGPHELAPTYALNLDRARSAIEGLAYGVFRPAGEPGLDLEGDRLVLVPGEPGRQLDVEASLSALVAAAQSGVPEPTVTLAFLPVAPRTLDLDPLQAQVAELLGRTIQVETYDLLTDRHYAWGLTREERVPWLTLEVGEAPEAAQVSLKPEAVRATLAMYASTLGEDRGFRLDEATQAVMAVHAKGGGTVTLRITYAPKTYIVQAGDTATRIADRHGMPLFALLQANPGVDLDRIRIGQEIVIPSQDVLTPLPPIPGKRVVVNIGRQRVYVYEDGQLIDDWIASTGREGWATQTGTFQVSLKEENAYASLWDLQMPKFVGFYSVGPGFTNGFHALPILASGARLWEGNLGRPVSYGCVILGVQEADTFYDWVEPGVIVVVEH